MSKTLASWPGRPFPLDATWDGEGVNFALFSEHARRVELCLFDARGRAEVLFESPPAVAAPVAKTISQALLQSTKRTQEGTGLRQA